MILAVLIIAVVIAMVAQRITGERALAAVEADHGPDTPLAEPGVPFSVEVRLRNPGRWPLPFIRVEEKLPPGVEVSGESDGVRQGSHGGQTAAFTAWLGPRRELVHPICVAAEKRGRYVLADLTVQCGDFLGLQEREKTSGSFREIVVAPKPLQSPRLDTVFGGFMGDMSARRFILEDPVLTLGFREYTGAEPMKRISWPQSAKRNLLMVKKNDYTQEPSVSVIVNVDTPMEDKEAALENCFRVARSVCDLLEKRGIRYSFATNAWLLGGRKGEQSGADGLGQRHHTAVLEQLGRAGLEAAMPLEQLLEKELRRPVHAGRILVTPGGGEELSRAVGRLREAAGGSLLVIRGREVSQWQ